MSITNIIGQQAVHGDLYNFALQTAYDAMLRLYDPDWSLAQDPAAIEKMKRDPVILNALNHRLHGIASRRWRLEAASESKEDRKAASIMEGVLGRIRRFDMARYLLASAVLTGRSYAQIVGGRRAMTIRGETRNWWIPTSLWDIDRRRIRFVPVKEDLGNGRMRITKRAEYWSIERRGWVEMRTDVVLEVVYEDAEGRLGYGRGLAEALYFYYYAKTILLREGLQAAERWAQGLKVAKIDRAARGGISQTTAQIADDFLAMLDKTMGRHAVVIDKSDEIDVVHPGEAGTNIIMELIGYIDRCMVMVIAGATLPTGLSGGDSSGSYARANVEENSMESLRQFDRSVIDDAMSGLIGLAWKLNAGNLAAIGLGDADPPRFVSIHEKKEDPEISARVIQTALAAGVSLRKDEVYSKIGFTPPREDDEVIEPRDPGLEMAPFPNASGRKVPDPSSGPEE